MELKTDDLHSFLTLCEKGSFTKAAVVLGISQSAISQKIARLEENLHSTLFIRNSRSLSITPSGEKLLHYAREVLQRQNEFLETFDQYQSELAGVIRIAGFSSVMSSIVIPKVAELMRKNSKLSIEFTSHKMTELEELLRLNRCDFIVTDYKTCLPNCEEIIIGEEEYIIIKSKQYKRDSHTFLDNSPEDSATESFFRFHNMKRNYDRLFMGDVFGIIEGVAQGLGDAVMSKHLIEKDKRFIIQKQRKRYVTPIVLTYHKSGYYPPAIKALIDLFI